MRPTTLDEVVGQEALVGSGAPLRRLLERGEVPSLLLWGPPGSGKSTVAAVIAAAVRAVPTSLSATSDGVADVRKVVAAAVERRAHGEQTLVFIDELHRFSRTQQDALLPHVEAGTIILVGATTEPPPRAISPALLSRMRTFRLAALNSDDLATLLQRALDDERGFGGTIAVDDDARRQLIGYAGGDARRMLTLLELAAHMTPTGKTVTPTEVLLAAQDPETGNGLTDLAVKANIVTFIAAGHETTANSLTWALYCLSQDPAAQARVEAEIDAAGPGDFAVERLPFTRAVIEEATAAHPFRLATSPSRNFLNTTFTETPTSKEKEVRPTVLIHPDDAAANGIADGDLVCLKNARGEVFIHARLFDGVRPGVLIAESIWPNAAHVGGNSTAWVHMQNFHRAVAVIWLGNAAGTVDASIYQATDEHGTGVKIVTGKTITPPLFESMTIVGTEPCLARVRAAEGAIRASM